MQFFSSLFLCLVLFIGLSTSQLKVPKGFNTCKDILIKDLPNDAFEATSSDYVSNARLNSRASGSFSATNGKEESKENLVKLAPHFIKKKESHHAWCPKGEINQKFDQFIQIDFQDVHIIKTFQVRGFDALNRVTPAFQIRYKRSEDETTWRIYQVENSSFNILKGLEKASGINVIKLDRIIVARWIRIYPYSKEKQETCLIMEAYGCKFAEAVSDYRAYQGSQDILNKEISFTDGQYDGMYDSKTGWLSNGLGVLTDLNVTTSQDSLPSTREPLPINRMFVGWNRESLPDIKRPIEIIFRFKDYQLFHQAKIFSVNNFPSNIKVPDQITIKTSIDGINYMILNQISSKESPQLNNDNGYHTIDVDMKSGLAKYVMLSLEFSPRYNWILLNEVYFKSDDASVDDVSRYMNEKVTEESTVERNTMDETTEAQAISYDEQFYKSDFFMRNPSSIIIFVIILLVIFVLFAACFLLFSCLWLHRRRVTNRKRSQEREFLDHKTNLITSRNNKQMSDQHFPLPYQTINNTAKSNSSSSQSGQNNRSCSTLNVNTNAEVGMNFFSLLRLLFCGQKYSKSASSASSSNDPSTSITSNQNSSQNGMNPNPQVTNGFVQFDFNNQNCMPTMYFPGTPMMPFNQPVQSYNFTQNPYINQVDPNQNMLNYATLSNLTQNYSKEHLLAMMEHVQQTNLLQQQQRNYILHQTDPYSPVNNEEDGNLSCEYASTGTMNVRDNRIVPCERGPELAPSPPPNHPNASKFQCTEKNFTTMLSDRNKGMESLNWMGTTNGKRFMH